MSLPYLQGIESAEGRGSPQVQQVHLLRHGSRQQAGQQDVEQGRGKKRARSQHCWSIVRWVAMETLQVAAASSGSSHSVVSSVICCSWISFLFGLSLLYVSVVVKYCIPNPGLSQRAGTGTAGRQVGRHPELKVRTPAHTKQLGRYVEFESRVTQARPFERTSPGLMPWRRHSSVNSRTRSR